MTTEPRLRELDQTMTAGPWLLSSDWLSGPSDAVGETHSFRAADADGIAFLRNALPEICALLDSRNRLEEALRSEWHRNHGLTKTSISRNGGHNCQWYPDPKPCAKCEDRIGALSDTPQEAASDE